MSPLPKHLFRTQSPALQAAHCFFGRRPTLISPCRLFSIFASIGLILAAIGVFSVMAYSVSLQTHDIGIRMALGAQPDGVLRMVMIKGLQPIIIGVLVGIGASYGLTK